MKKLLKLSSFLAILTGIILVAGGLWSASFTYKNVSRENIVTPSDASIPDVRVRGPFTLKAQADVIRMHALRIAGGATYSEMPRQVPLLDEEGSPVLNREGEPVLVANSARDMWITATTLITALNLGIITYVLSALMFLLGLISVWTGIVFFALSRRF